MMPLCPCFRPKDPEKEKEDVLKRLNVLILGDYLDRIDVKPGQIIDHSNIFGQCDPFHKISVEKIGLWVLNNYVKYDNDDDTEIRDKCDSVLMNLSFLHIYLKVPKLKILLFSPTFLK